MAEKPLWCNGGGRSVRPQRTKYVLKSATELKRAVAVCSGQIAACKESGLTNFSHIHRSACRRIVGKNSLNRAIRPRLGKRIRSRLCRSCRLRGGGAASRFASILERG